MRYEAVLFDMDGTVLNTLDDLANAVNYSLRQFSMPEHSAAEVAGFLGNGAKYLIEHAVPAGTSPEVTAEVLKFYSPWYNSHCAVLTAPYVGIIPLMEALKAAGVRQAVISNKQDAAVRPLAAQHFPGLLDLAVGETASVHRKPSPDMVLAALKEMGICRERAIFVGDTEVDIETARNAGMDCAIVSWGFRTPEQLRAIWDGRIFQNPEELRQYLLA